jgi:hypothetical protein
MNRRHFIVGSSAAGLAVIGSAAIWLNIDAYNKPLTVQFALKHLDALMQKTPATTGDWGLTAVFEHLAQSVEYSMTGYPEHKAEWFKQTLGKTAFSVFSAKREMSHALNEAIPGAPSLSTLVNVEPALARFRQSLLAFESHKGSLAPHFAYGVLSKAQYEQAHIMHFNNHLQEISALA